MAAPQRFPSCEFFVDLNCARFPGGLLEVELCGDVHGTRRLAEPCQLLEIAQKGTIFLDEIESMDPKSNRNC